MRYLSAVALCLGSVQSLQIDAAANQAIRLNSKVKNVVLIRGGALSNYASAASDLFSNMRSPAALIGGSIVPIGFAAAPEISKSDSKFMNIFKKVYMIIAILSLSCEIIAVTYSTIAINKLSESVVPSTSSVIELLKRDYELQWLGCNVNFLLGLLGFAAMIGMRSWIYFGPKFGRVGLLGAGSVLAHCLSIINHGIAVGDGTGSKFGSNFFGIVKRYLFLQATDSFKKKGIFQFSAYALFIAALFYALKLSPNDK